VINLTQQPCHFYSPQVFHLIFRPHSEKYLVCFYEFCLKQKNSGQEVRQFGNILLLPLPPLHKARRCYVVTPENFSAHESKIVTKQMPGFCPKCKGSHSDFALHERRHRLFYVIIDSLVHTIESFLGRWRCSLCRATFTAYPEYALPYKRYVRDVCVSLGKAYVENDAATYRSVVKPFEYKTETANANPRMLERTTVWRWISFFGSLKNTLHNAFEIIRQSAPDSTVFRQISPIHHKKYRNKKRKYVLERAFQLFAAEAEFQGIWGYSFFPDLATRCCWS